MDTFDNKKEFETKLNALFIKDNSVIIRNQKVYNELIEKVVESKSKCKETRSAIIDV